MISVLENIDTKKRMLEACIDKLHAFAQAIKARMKNSMKEELTAHKAMEEEAALMASAVGNLETQALEQDLDNAVKEMRILKYLQKTCDEDHDKVGLGAVVVTHRNVFYVCADLQRFDLEGEKFIAISSQCPLFKSMRGKRKGDRFIHKNLSYQILDIY